MNQIDIQAARILSILLLLGLADAAPAFPPDWSSRWKAVRDEGVSIRRTDGGALEVDGTPRKHVYLVGGEELSDLAVTAKVKFLRADDKYSGFSIYLRWRGEVWGQRDGFWVYLRPKYRSLYMAKVHDGRLEKGFPKHVKAKRPASTPLGEWLTLRCEARGRSLKVFLNGEEHLAVKDDGMFPILRGRMAFGVGDSHVVVAELTQENLAESARLPAASYTYATAPNRGDPDRSVLTDARVNPREEQAFWRMLGARPEITFDLGQERFVERAVLRGISSPAVNISSAEIQGSVSGKQWTTLAVLQNKDGRRAAAEHEVAGEVRGIARYIRLLLNRPAADQDVVLAEVEFYGRTPTEADRASVGAKAYAIGPELPATSEAQRADAHYWYLASDTMRVAIDRVHGLVAGVWNGERSTKCIERLPDRYYLVSRSGDGEATEYEDAVTNVLEERLTEGVLSVRCTNAKLPDVVIEKAYSLSTDGRRLVTRVAFRTLSQARDRFLTHATGGVLVEDFRRDGVYMGCDRGLGARLFANDVNVPRQVGALGARNSKTVILQRYDLGWGLAQYRHKVNDRYCRPLTSRWHEKENHPPVYLPNGWEMGLATLHLAPDEAASTETHLALYNGRQIDFYRMYRHLPEVRSAYDAVKRPDWVRDLKTSCSVALNPLCADLTGPLLPVRRTLQMTETGCLWSLKHIHGVWGEWFSEGVMTNGYGARLDTQWLKQYIDAARDLSPRVKLGVYTWAWAVHPHSKVFKEHPDWFITRDRNGQVFNAYSNMVLNHARRFGINESMDELMDQFARIMRDFRGDFFYLDGGGGGQNLIDWEHLGCDQDYHYEELYRRIREVSRACGPDRAVWFNARTGPYWDIGYYEGIDRMLHASTWRDSADGLSAVKIRQVFDPGQVVVPLYWRPPTLPFFSNYCIGLGITPSAPLGSDQQLKKLPFIEAAYETRSMQWVEADLDPDWRVDPSTEIEAYALKHGRAAVISVIDHRESGSTSATISADVAKLGLDRGKPIHAWVYAARDIRESWPALPEAVRRRLYRETGWGLDLAGRLLRVETFDRPDARLTVTVPTEPQVLRMVFLSHSSAGVFAVAGLRTHFCCPDNLGAWAEATPTADGRSLHVRAHAPSRGAELAVLSPKGKMPAERQSIRRFRVGDRWLGVLSLAAGAQDTKVALQDEPKLRTADLAVRCPTTVKAGGRLVLGLPDAATKALVSVWRQDVLLYVDEPSVSQGAVGIEVPKHAHEGDVVLRVVARLGDRARAPMSAGQTRVRIADTQQPELTPVYLPRTGPKRRQAAVGRRVRDIEVLRTATASHDGYDGEHFAYADADKLTIGGGSVDAPRSRYGYGFGGIELRNARVLTLRITSTFHDAWTFYRGRVSFKPRYTTTFAGLMVDYATGQGYTHRAALGLGLLNPKRTTHRPEWGAAKAPDAFVSLGNMLFERKETVCTIDLARWAPAGWNGSCWITAGADNVLPSRRVMVEILENADSPAGKTILKGESLGDLYKMRTHRVRRVPRPPVIDGKLEPDVWQRSHAAEGFRALGRLGRSKQETRAWLAYDDGNLYVAFECGETEKEQLNTAAKKLWNQDAVDLALDVDGDRGDFHQIIVNCRNERAQFDQGTGGRKREWQIRTACHSDGDTWCVEMAMPFAEIRVAPKKGTKWTGNFVRYRPYPPVHEILTWSPIPGDSLLEPKRFGEYVFE